MMLHELPESVIALIIGYVSSVSDLLNLSAVNCKFYCLVATYVSEIDFCVKAGLAFQ